DDGYRQPREFAHRYRGGEAAEDEVRGMDLEHEGGVLVNRSGVVIQSDPVRGADLTKTGAGRLNKLWNTKPIPDLNEFSPGDHNVLASREHPGREREGSGSVVDDVHAFGIRDGSSEPVQGRPSPPSAVARLQIHLDVGRPTRGFDRFQRGSRQ